VRERPSNIPTPSIYPLLPNSSFHFSKACSPSLLTLGLTFLKLIRKSPIPMALISSRLVVNNASPNDRKGPIAASFVNAVISDPENPIHQYPWTTTFRHGDKLFKLLLCQSVMLFTQQRSELYPSRLSLREWNILSQHKSSSCSIVNRPREICGCKNQNTRRRRVIS